MYETAVVYSYVSTFSAGGRYMLWLWLRVSVIGQMMLGIIMGKAKPRAGRSSSRFLAYVLFRLRF